MISIIIPVYNAINYLDKCIASVISQDFSDIEIILVNDGSTDSSKELCDSYAKNDPRIKVFHKENGGVSSARNLGIEKCSGEFLLFLDSDDTLKSGILQKLSSSMISEVSICIGGFDNIYQDSTLPAQPNTNGIFSKSAFMTKCFDALYYKSIIAAPTNKLYRKELITQNKIQFNEQLVVFEDFLFALEYINISDSIAVINDMIYNYNQTNLQSALKKYQPRFAQNAVTYINTVSTFLPEDILTKLCYSTIMRSFYQEYRIINNIPKQNITDSSQAKTQVINNFSYLNKCTYKFSLIKLLLDVHINKNIKLVCLLLRLKCYKTLYLYGIQKGLR